MALNTFTHNYNIIIYDFVVIKHWLLHYNISLQYCDVWVGLLDWSDYSFTVVHFNSREVNLRPTCKYYLSLNTTVVISETIEWRSLSASYGLFGTAFF